MPVMNWARTLSGGDRLPAAGVNDPTAQRGAFLPLCVLETAFQATRLSAYVPVNIATTVSTNEATATQRGERAEPADGGNPEQPLNSHQKRSPCQAERHS